MSEMAEAEAPRMGFVQKWRTKAVVALGSVGLAAAPVAAATDLNASIGPILDGVIALIPTIIALLIAAIPAIIVISVVAFVTGFLDGIIKQLKF